MTKHWKSIERKIATFFGTERTPLSGGNSKITRSDSLHHKLFLEVKQRKNPAVVSLFENTAEMAKLENKIPVLGIHKKGSRLWLVVCEIGDLVKVASELKEQKDGAQDIDQDDRES